MVHKVVHSLSVQFGFSLGTVRHCKENPVYLESPKVRSLVFKAQRCNLFIQPSGLCEP